jgi:hypothetical protein
VTTGFYDVKRHKKPLHHIISCEDFALEEFVMLGEISVGEGMYRLSRSGIAFETRVRKTRGSLFHTLPRQVCVGCGMMKGQKLTNYLVYYDEGRIGLFIPLENSLQIKTEGKD